MVGGGVARPPVRRQGLFNEDRHRAHRRASLDINVGVANHPALGIVRNAQIARCLDQHARRRLAAVARPAKFRVRCVRVVVAIANEVELKTRARKLRDHCLVNTTKRFKRCCTFRRGRLI